MYVIIKTYSAFTKFCNLQTVFYKVDFKVHATTSQHLCFKKCTYVNVFTLTLFFPFLSVQQISDNKLLRCKKLDLQTSTQTYIFLSLWSKHLELHLDFSLVTKHVNLWFWGLVSRECISICASTFAPWTCIPFKVSQYVVKIDIFCNIIFRPLRIKERICW